MTRKSLEAELERRFGDAFAPQELDWRGDQLIGLAAHDLDLARVVLASPAAAQLERLCLFCDLDEIFGRADRLTSEPVAPLDELLAGAPFATTVHASAESIAIRSHDRLETLSLVAPAWPLRGAAFPALQRLELFITETPVTREDLASALAACPRLTELVLRGAGCAGLVAGLGSFAYPPGLALVVDVEIGNEAALALANAPGTLAALGRLSLPAESPANRLALIGLEQAVPLATHGHVLATVARWAVIERVCFGPVDPMLRIWEWQTREEGRSSGWIAFLPRRIRAPMGPRETELVRACEANVPGGTDVYADWLEDNGAQERAIAIRAAGLPFLPQTLAEAMAILASAWKRTSPGWVRDRQAGSVEPLSVEDFQSYLELFSNDEHPLAPDAIRAIQPAQFDERVQWLLEMMRARVPARLYENEWLVRDDVATFTPPLGPARTALQLRDVWNDMFLAAETEHGFALVIWGTGA